MASNSNSRNPRPSTKERSAKKKDLKNDSFSILNCSVCNFECQNADEFDLHKATKGHMLNYIKHFLHQNRSSLVEDKHGVSVSCLEYRSCVPSLIVPTKPDQLCKITLCIENVDLDVVFLQYEFLTKMPCIYHMNDEYKVCDGDRAIKMSAASKYHVILKFQPQDVGHYMAPLVFLFQKQNGDIFYIVRYIELHCQDAIVESLQPIEHYDPTEVDECLKPAEKIYKGLKFKRTSSFHPKQVAEIQLKKVAIPHETEKAIEIVQKIFHHSRQLLKEAKGQPAVNTIMQLLKDGLTPHTHKYYFRILLNFEEVQMNHDIRKYDMTSQKMTKSKQSRGHLSLIVPGLAEQRPSVVLGDHIYVRRRDERLNRKDVEYEGYVHEIDDNQVSLGFGPQLLANFISGMLFDVRFTFNKLPLYSMHRSLDIITDDQLKYVLFPSWAHAASCPTLFNPTDNLSLYNRKIEENPEQLIAIKHIVAGSSLPAPYLIHGPPGTGKTSTVVETIKQVLKRKTIHETSYILVATPSNSASDLITERLLDHIDGSQIMRLYAYSREWKHVPAKIKESRCCNYDPLEGGFYMLPREKLMSYRIIISTLINCTRIVSAAVPEGHFTHVFIDEAGHSLEPETLIPVAGLLSCRAPGSPGFGGQLVLAGDPLQLGPIIRCKVADKYNLGRSFLERLMTTCDVYQRKNGKYDPRVLTRLLRNYRSHPAIVNLPSQLFYDGELQVYADKLERESLCHWEGLTDNEFPVLFHGVYGRDQREKKSPSYFNAEEVAIVLGYVQKLVTARNMGLRIEQHQIGIITPYKQQVHKIKNELQKKNFHKIGVGSVDQFQGQERRVIIISTVRSNPDLMAYDSQFKLGFVKNPKRFNVSITRAKSLLIIVGNPKLLALDKHWKEMLMYCWKRGSYVGSYYDPPEQEIADVLERMKSLCLMPTLSPEEQGIKISQRAQQEDPQWRDDF